MAAFVGQQFAAMPPWDVPSDSEDDYPTSSNSDSSLTSSDNERYDDYSVQKKLKVQMAKLRRKMVKYNKLMKVAYAAGNHSESDRQLARYRRLEVLWNGYNQRLGKLTDHLYTLPGKTNIISRII